jgi:hypothetical protein
VQISIATKIAPKMDLARKEQQPKFHRRCSPIEDVGPCLVPGIASIDHSTRYGQTLAPPTMRT